MTTYGKLELTPDRSKWHMTGIPPHVAIRLKQIFPRIAKAETELFTFPNNEDACSDLDWFCSRYRMQMSKRDARALRGGRLGFENAQAELGRIFSPDYSPPTFAGLKPGKEIRPYQAQAVQTVLRRKGLLLGDGVGLGKTISAIGMMLHPQTLPAAVVVQTALQSQWAEKIAEFSNLRVHIITVTKPYALPVADVYIFRYSQLLGWVDFFATDFFKAVVYDEIQELRTGDASGRGEAAMVLSSHCKYRLGLSATPIYNYGIEAFNIMRFLDSSVLGGKEEFVREWTRDGKIVDNGNALGSFLREQYVYLRRTKADVGQQMPPVNRIIETVESDEAAMKDIRDLARVLALRTIHGSFTERGEASRALDLMARQATGVGKAKFVAAYVRILLENDIPVLLAGWHREVYDIWNRELAEFRPVMCTGSESPTQKEASKKAFINGETNLMFISLRAAVGIDGLQKRCSTVVLGELDWSGKLMDQVIGRLDREGQMEQVTAIFCVSEDGSDPPMVDLIGLKNAQADSITNLDSEFVAPHSDTSRIRRLAQQFLSLREMRDALRKAGGDEVPKPTMETVPPDPVAQLEIL